MIKTKMLFTLTILFFLIGCTNKNEYINILSDDISIMECVNRFNAQSNDIKAVFNYKEPDKDKNLFDLVNEKKVKNIDLITSFYGPKTILSKKNFVKLPTLFNKKDNIFKCIKDFTRIENNLVVPYAIDFPVIIANKKVLPKDLSSDYLSMEQFTNIAKSVNFVKKRERYTEKRLGFVPTLSYYDELDYYFIFNSPIIKKGNRIIFDSVESRRAFDFYHNFDEKNNYGNEFIKEYKEHFANINKQFYLKMRVLSLDFQPFSKAVLYPQNKYKIFFIKGLKNISLTIKAIGILKQSRNKKDSIKFLKFLLESNQQETLYNIHLVNLDYYQNLYMPIRKDIVNKYQLNFINTNLLEKNLESYNYPDFISINIQKKFLGKYKQNKELIQNGLMENSEFLKEF